MGARLEFRPLIGRANPIRIGADWRRTTGRTEEDFFFAGTVPGRHRTAGGDSDTVGAFAEWTSGYRDYGLVWTVSGRVDRWWLGEGYRNERNISGPVITDLRFAARPGWEGSGRAGVQWTQDALSLRGAVYRGWRLPTLNELYRPFRVGAEVTTANEMLKPERLWGGEVGVDWKRDDTKLSATLFVNHLTNAIANVTLAPNLNQRQNLDAIDTKGIEVSAEQKVDFLTLRATYALTDATVDASRAAAALDGRRPAQIAKHGGSVSLRSNTTDAVQGFDVRFDNAHLDPVTDYLKRRWGKPFSEGRETISRKNQDPRESYKVLWEHGKDRVLLSSLSTGKRVSLSGSRGNFEEEIYRVK